MGHERDDDRQGAGEPPAGPERPDLAERPRLRRLPGGGVGGVVPAASVRLHREFKGLTVADLVRIELVEQLPGTVHKAMRELQRGDLAAAEATLPGTFAPLLAGPGRARRQWRRVLAVLLVLVVVLLAGLAWSILEASR
jgi:hypothetical protein